MKSRKESRNLKNYLWNIRMKWILIKKKKSVETVMISLSYYILHQMARNVEDIRTVVEQLAELSKKLESSKEEAMVI